MTKDDFVNALQNIDVVWLTIFGEARGEPIEGMIAVGCVIRNRVIASKMTKTYKDVCLAPLQFSCWNENDPNLNEMMVAAVGTTPRIREIKFIGAGIYQNMFRDNTSGSTHYLTTRLFHENPPTWATSGKVMATIGNHTFLQCA